jgi:hypothetical protein
VGDVLKNKDIISITYDSALGQIVIRDAYSYNHLPPIEDSIVPGSSDVIWCSGGYTSTLSQIKGKYDVTGFLINFEKILKF